MRTRHLLLWCKLNLAVPLTLLTIGAGIGVQAVMSEIGPGSYTILADNWKHMSPATRHSVSTTLQQDGMISQWQYKPLFEALMHDAGAVVVPEVDYDRQSARERLLAIARDGEAGNSAAADAGTNASAPRALTRKD
ncbi:hypothetical protein [Paraburkholderia youngii]|uniref:hypothetical protein n=1 Tax=Paraburkholderia youngii TaxID=2782701 RepID=UPI003D1BF1D5